LTTIFNYPIWTALSYHQMSIPYFIYTTMIFYRINKKLIRAGIIIGGTILIIFGPIVDHSNKKMMFWWRHSRGVDGLRHRNAIISYILGGIAHTHTRTHHWIHTSGPFAMSFFPFPFRIEPHYNNGFVGKSTKVDWSKWIFFSVVQWWWLPNIVRNHQQKSSV
jgi:hypothetical protein